jgi:hypothetical protein
MTRKIICCENIKSKDLGKFTRQIFTGFVAFIGGFLVGTIIDVIFYRLYLKWDSERKSLKKLLTVVSIQVFVLAIILSFEENFANIKGLDAVVFRLALVMSQIFMVKYSMERISDELYHRTELTSKLAVPDEALKWSALDRRIHPRSVELDNRIRYYS